MGKHDFIFMNLKEAYETVDSRLLSNGYGIYKLKFIEKSTGKITVMHVECGTSFETCLEHIEDGILPKKCPHCDRKEKTEKLIHQRKIAAVIRSHHLELVSKNEDDYYIKCNLCGKEYYLDNDFYYESEPDAMYCKNWDCVIHNVKNGDFGYYTDALNNGEIEILDHSNYYPHSFVECIEDWFDSLSADDVTYKRVCPKCGLTSTLQFGDDKDCVGCYVDDGFKVESYDALENVIKLTCKDCGCSYTITYEDYQDGDYECPRCKDNNANKLKRILSADKIKLTICPPEYASFIRGGDGFALYFNISNLTDAPMKLKLKDCMVFMGGRQRVSDYTYTGYEFTEDYVFPGIIKTFGKIWTTIEKVKAGDYVTVSLVGDKLLLYKFVFDGNKWDLDNYYEM